MDQSPDGLQLEVAKQAETSKPSSIIATTEKGFKDELTKFGVNVEKVAEACSILPENYNFEIWKTLYRIHLAKSKADKDQDYKIALQFPEGLLIYSTLISDIIQNYCKVSTVILGDVTYGACCIDDLGAKAVGANFIVHYAHSCLVPIQEMVIKDVLYVFVTIGINFKHFVNTVISNLEGHKESKIYMFGTIQFTNSLFMCKKLLLKEGFKDVNIPQTKPRSSGEVLGCTSPKIPEAKEDIVCIFLADGRFHIESVMIKNQHIEFFYQYDPYSRKFTKEKYDIPKMHDIRQQEITKARSAKCIGIILGTLGRQGNRGLLNDLKRICKSKDIKYIILLLSEISPQKLDKFSDIDAWIQIACPRLSIDWGHNYSKPILNTYEAHVLLDQIQWQKSYPMDFYSNDAGEWGVYFKINKIREQKKLKRKANKDLKISYEE